MYFQLISAALLLALTPSPAHAASMAWCAQLLTQNSREKIALQITEAYRRIIVQNLDQVLQRSDLEAMIASENIFAIERANASELEPLRLGLKQLEAYATKNVQNFNAFQSDLIEVLKETLRHRDEQEAIQNTNDVRRNKIAPRFIDIPSNFKESTPTHLAFSVDNKTLALISGYEFSILNTKTGKVILYALSRHATFEDQPDNEVKISDDSKILYILSNHLLAAWYIKNGERVRAFPTDRVISSLDTRLDLVAVASRRTIFVYSNQGRHQLKYQLENKFNTWWSELILSPDGKTLFASSVNGKIVAWNAQTGEELYEVDTTQDKVTGNFAFVEGGKRLIFSSVNSTEKLIGMIDVATGTLSKTLISPDGLSGGEIQVSSDGKWLAAKTHEHCYIWNLKAGTLLYDLKEVFEKLTAPNSYFSEFIFLENTDQILLFAADGQPYFFNLVSHKLRHESHAKNIDINTLKPLTGEKRFATVTYTGEVRIWDIKQIEEEGF